MLARSDSPAVPRFLARPGVLVVVACVAGAAVLNTASAIAGPAELRDGALVTGYLAALLLAGFWWLGGVLIDAAARSMGQETRRDALLARSARTFPVVLGFPLLTLIQTVLVHAGHGDAAAAIGWLALPTLGWFMAAGVAAVAATYELEMFNAVALGLLPYAVIAAALLVVIVLISALHVARLI